MKSNGSHRSLPQSRLHRPGQNLSGTRDKRRTRHGRRPVTAKETQAPTQVPQFLDAPLYRTAGNYGGALTADFNGDGRLDLLMNESILLGNGDGTFQSPNQQVVYSGEYESVGLGDFNHDGKLDLAVVAAPNITIQLGNGDGTFRVSVSYPVAGHLSSSTDSIAVSDFNGDGQLDLAIVYTREQNPYNPSYYPSVGILLGNGDGTFQPLKDFPVESGSSVAIGDFNRDGKPDVAVVGADSVYVLFGNGDGSLQPYVSYPVTNPGNIAVASLRGNGQLDLVITSSDVTVRVLLGNGDGTFQSQTGYGAVGTSQYHYDTPVLADFNGDGTIDVAFVNADANQAGVLFGNGDGTFGAELLFGTGQVPMSLTAGDFNGDGKLDLATEDIYNPSDPDKTVGVLLGNGDDTFQARHDYMVQGFPTGVTVGDFNGDGNPDMAVAVICYIYWRSDQPCAYRSRTVHIFLGKSDGTFSAPVTYAVQDVDLDSNAMAGPSSIVSADLNHDGKLDIVAGNFQTIGTNNVLGMSVLLGNGDGTFQAHSDYPGASVVQDIGLPSEGASLATADLNDDGNLDIVATGPELGAVVWLGNGDGTFRTGARYSNTGTGSSALAIGDFNGDGKPDLAVTNGSQTFTSTCDLVIWDFQGSTVSVLLGKGDGSFGPPVAYETTSDPESVAVGDFDKDGKLDLVVVGGVGPISILLGNGNGTFQKAMEFPIEGISYPEMSVPAVPIAVAISDFNLDGMLDVVVGSGYSDANIGLLYGNGDGTFQPPTTYTTGTEPYMIAVGDFNHDGKPDLATANTGTDTVSVLRNIQGPDFSLQAAGLGPITRGKSASSTVTISSILGFSNSVTLSCAVSLTSGTGTVPSCSLSPASVQLAANGSAISTLTINTSGSAAVFHHAPFGQDGRNIYALWLSISGLAFAMLWTTRIRKNKIAVVFASTLLAALLVLSACGGNSGGSTSGSGGGGGGGGNPPSDATYSVSVTATSGSLVRIMTLAVTVQ